jgi:sugar/nucleoside kinase (ribokinase family)
VFVGEVVVDVTTWIDAFPARGSDTLADAATLTPGGGFNVMAAAARQGMAVLFAGRHGAGVAGDTVRAALAAEGIEVLRAADRSADTGVVVTMVEPDGERTFVTSPAALRGTGDLGAVPVAPDDFVYVSGYGLASAHGPELADWVGSLGPRVTVIADPGSLVADLPRRLLDAVLARTDWWSCNRREATVLTGVADPAWAAVVLAGAGGGGGVMVRDGAAGCVLVHRTSPHVHRIAAPNVTAIDTTGAGDTHVGVFVAGLAAGRTPLDAARRATVAASLSVTARGPATAPGRDLLEEWLRTRPEGPAPAGRSVDPDAG